MKKLTSLFVILALLMLCACGSKTGATADGAAAPDSSDIPEVCRVYEDYVLMEAIAPQNSRLPLASDAARGAPDYVPLWHEGEYSQLAAHGGEGWRMDELTDGKATEGGDYGRFCWDGQLYHCIHVQGADSFIPGFCSVGGGVLWLELEGDCRADNGTGGEIGLFGGFDTVVITGTGTLTLAQGIESGTGAQPWPALIVDGVDVTAPGLSLTANSGAGSTANLVVQSGSLTVEGMAFVNGDVCVTGGSPRADRLTDCALTAGQLMDCARLVCWGGETRLTEGWGFSEGNTDTAPTVLLNGGAFRADSWLPENIEYQLWRGSIAAPGVRHWPGTHLLGDGVEISDPLDE